MKPIPFHLAVGLALVASTLSVTGYVLISSAAPEPRVILVQAPDPPPPPRVVVPEPPPPPDPPPDPPDIVERPARPAPGYVAPSYSTAQMRRMARTEEGAQTLFTDAVEALRNRESVVGCDLLNVVATRAPVDSRWRQKSEGLFVRRCADRASRR